MLVLTRKAQEKIQIGDSIAITILRIKGGAVRLGIEAPDGVRVLRSELLEKEVRNAECGMRSKAMIGAKRAARRAPNSTLPSPSLLQFRAANRERGGAADSTDPRGERGASAPWELPTGFAVPSGG